MNQPKQSEKELQQDIVTHLTLLGYRCYQFGKPGGRPKCPNCGAWVGSLAGGAPTGFPDLLVINSRYLPPAYVFLEVKTATGRLQPVQQAVHQDMREAGASVRVVRSPEEAERVMKEAL